MDDDVADQTEREYSGENVEQDYTGGTEASWEERGLSNEDFDNSISGQMDLNEEGDDAANAFLGLSNVEAKDSFIGNADLITSETNQLERFSHMSQGVGRAALGVLTGQTQHISGKRLSETKASFEAAIGKSSAQFIKGLNIQASEPVNVLDPWSFTMKEYNQNGKLSYRVAPVESPNILGTFTPMPSKAEVMTASSMLTSVESYEARGPGGNISGNLEYNIKNGSSGNIEGYYDDDFDRRSEEDKRLNKGSRDKRIKADQDFALAMSYIGELAELYIDPKTKSGEIYGKQKAGVEFALTKRFLDGQYSDEAKSILPLPNETGVTGLRATRGSIGGNQGTPFTRLEFGIEAHKRGWTAEGVGLKEGEENPYWRYMGTVGQSLFHRKFVKDAEGNPNIEANNENTRIRKYKEQQALDKARFARKILLEQMPTLRDETAGQPRSPGFDKPYGDQANIQYILDQGFIQGLDYSEYKGESSDLMSGRYDSSGSKMKDWIDSEYSLIDASYVPSLSANKVVGPDSIEGIRQRTPAWYAARSTMITASKLTNASGQRLDAEGMAAQLALEELSKSDPKLAKELEFIGTSHTRDGQVGEAIALREFLLMQKVSGDALTHTEVGLLQNNKMPGFGASPDGRLTDSEGNNRGLLELKYLTSGSMGRALKKYTPQMQLQMAVTGETETNFFALDKYTGESIHDVVYADPELQAEILEEGRRAIELSKTLTKEEAMEMKKQTRAGRRKQSNLEEVNETGDGQKESYSTVDYKDKEMTTFSLKDINKVNSRIYQADKNRAIKRKFESISAMKEFDDQVVETTRASKAEAEADKASARTTRDREQADKSAARATIQLRNAALEAASSLAAIGLRAKDSSMSTINLANRIGEDEGRVRGMESALAVKGGIPLVDAKKIIESSGDTISKLSVGVSAGGELLRINTALGSTPEIYNKLGKTPDRSEMLSMGAGGLAAFVQGEMNQFPEGNINRKIIANAYGFPDSFAASVATKKDMSQTINMDKEGNRDYNEGVESFSFFSRMLAERATAVSGKGGGVLTAVADTSQSNAKTVAWIADNKIAAAAALAAGTLSIALYNKAMGIDDESTKKPVGGAASIESSSNAANSVDDPDYEYRDDLSRVGAVSPSMAAFNIAKKNNKAPIDASIPLAAAYKMPTSEITGHLPIPKETQAINWNDVNIQIINSKENTEASATVNGEDNHINQSRETGYSN
jgi:hypothetical protein